MTAGVKRTPTAIRDGMNRELTQDPPRRLADHRIGNTDVLRSSRPETRTPTGWTARECSPILLSGIAAMDGSDCFWARSISRQAHKSTRARARLQSAWQRGDPAKVTSSSGRARSDLRSSDRQRRATRKGLTMGPHVTSDGALGGGRLSVGDVGGWLNAYVYRAESAFCLGRDLAATMRDSILRRVSGCDAASIHVSAMSDSWLRMHETDYDKHRAEL